MRYANRIYLIALGLLLGCSNDHNNSKDPAPAATAIMPVDSVKSFNAALVDNKKDPSCGMPVTAGISDTAHYNNKVLGFCSTECKDSFLKDAKNLFASVEFKK